MTSPAPLDCGCPAGRRITDPARHAAFHALVVKQGGPAGLVDLVTCRAARGQGGETLPAETFLDRRARATGKRASGALRRASADG